MTLDAQTKLENLYESVWDHLATALSGTTDLRNPESEEPTKTLNDWVELRVRTMPNGFDRQVGGGKYGGELRVVIRCEILQREAKATNRHRKMQIRDVLAGALAERVEISVTEGGGGEVGKLMMIGLQADASLSSRDGLSRWEYRTLARIDGSWSV